MLPGEACPGEGQGQSLDNKLQSGELCPHWAEEAAGPPAELRQVREELERHPPKGGKGRGSWFPQIFVARRWSSAEGRMDVREGIGCLSDLVFSA